MRLLAPVHPLLPQALVGLASCHRRAGRYGPAAEALHRALPLATDPVPGAAVRTELGIAAKELGDHDQAAHWYAEVTAIHQTSGHQASGTTRADAAAHQHNLAGLAYACGDHSTASHRHAPSIAEQAYPPTHPLITAIRTHLARPACASCPLPK